MITQTLKLNLIPGQVLPRVNVSQYDAGTRTLQMLLYNGDQTFNISAGVGGFVQGTKPDRTGFQYAATVTQGSNVVTLVVTQQMTAVSGEVTCELVLADGDNRIATVNFIIYVEPAALADDTVISDTELPLIEEAAELAQRIDGIAQQVSDDADRAETAADNAELWASRSPYIGQNGNWFVFDTTTEAYIDTQISATGPQGQTGPTGPQGPQGDAATITVGTVTTLPAGSQATVTNSGTSEAAVFNFGIPKGRDGTGAGDMAKADYDANGAVENAGGIASYVSGAISGKANTADLGTAAYKASTNAVTSGSTDLVESGAVYTEITSLDTDKQDKTDNTLDTTSKSVVGAINEVNTNKADKTQISNPNLLDNPWFTVNQRGQNSYTNYGASAYCYDRWIANSISNTSLSFSDDNGLVATVGSTAPSGSPYITQRIDASRLSVGDTYTVSMLVKSSNDNTVYLQFKDKSGNNILNSNGKSLAANTWTVITATGVMTATTDYYELRVYFNYTKTANNVSCVKAVKLEKGIVSTILLDNKPNYATELLKCKRYYCRIQKRDNDKTVVIGYGYIQYQTTNDARITITLPTEMRTTPSVNFSEKTRFGINVSGSSSPLTNNTTITVGSISNNMVFLQIVDSSFSFTSLAMITLSFNKKNDYIEFSADL